MQDLGRFIYGDAGTDVELTLRDQDGMVVDLTGATLVSLECTSPQRDVFSLAGEVQSPDSAGIVLFEDIALAFVPTRQRPKVSFEGFLKWTLGGEVFYSLDSVKFSIELFP